MKYQTLFLKPTYGYIIMFFHQFTTDKITMAFNTTELRGSDSREWVIDETAFGEIDINQLMA